MYFQKPNLDSKNQKEPRVRKTLAASGYGDQRMTDGFEAAAECKAGRILWSS